MNPQPVDRVLFTIDKIMGPTLLKTSFRNLAGIISKGLDEGFDLAIVSFKHTMKCFEMIENGREVTVWRRITNDITNLEFDFMYFVCEEGQELFIDHGGGIRLLARRRVN